MNPDNSFTIEKIENKLELKTNQLNKNIITREQRRKDKENRSTLDFFMSTHKIEHLEKLDKYESDHYPILTKIQSANPSKRENTLKWFRKT